MPAPDPPPVDASPAPAPARMDRLDRSLMVGMAALVVVSAVGAYVGGRYDRDDLLLLPLVLFWVVVLLMAPMFALGGCCSQYRGRRLQTLGLRGLVIALALGGWVASVKLHSLGRIEMLKGMFPREVIAAIRSSSAVALAAHPDELDLQLYGSHLPAELEAVVGGSWRLDIERWKWADPPRIQLWRGNHITACGIVMMGYSADSHAETPGPPDDPAPDDETAYFPWLDGSLLLMGRDD